MKKLTFLNERKNERVVNMNVNEFIFEKFERERERVHILSDELERELERQKTENFQYSARDSICSLTCMTVKKV